MFDLVIIGGGPAGLTAGIYAQRARLKTVLLEKQMVGGQIAVSDVIENYPGFPSISGAELMEKFEAHARGLGLEIRFTDVLDIAVDGNTLIVNGKRIRLTAEKDPANLKWNDIEGLFKELGTEITEREGSRVGVRLFGERRVFHRPHPSQDMDKGAVACIRKWFEENGVRP